MIGYLKLNVGTPIALGRGLVEGFWGGMKSDYDGIAGASALVGRFSASAAERAAVIKQLRAISFSTLGTQIANGLQAFMTQAEKNAVVLTFGQADITDDFLARVYVDGYAMGFVSEQLVSTALFAGAAAKVGTAAKAVIAATKPGQAAIAAVSRALSYKAIATSWVINIAKNNVVTEAVAKTSGAMVDRVAALPTDQSRQYFHLEAPVERA